MSDYCACGNIANARCACGATICRFHTKHPQTYHSTVLNTAARDREGRPDHALFAALNNAWETVPGIMCAGCYGQAIDHVAGHYAQAFQSHTDGSAEKIASALLTHESWTTGQEYQSTETIGQKTLLAAGHHVPWSHPDSLDTAVRFYAHRHGEPPEQRIRIQRGASRKTLFGGRKWVESIERWGWITAWKVSTDFWDADSGSGSAALLIGATGARADVPPSPGDGVIFYNPDTAEEAKAIVEGSFQASPTTNSLSSAKEKALIGELLRGH